MRLICLIFVSFLDVFISVFKQYNKIEVDLA